LLFCSTGTSANRFGNPHDLQCSGYLELCSVAILCYAVQRLIEFPLMRPRKTFPTDQEIERPQTQITRASGRVCVGITAYRPHISFSCATIFIS
jgi:hypothetical protein